MIPYKDIDGDSGVYAFEYGIDFIRVEFSTRSVYLYTYNSAGVENIERMKILAQRGEGLNAYINKSVRKLYARKER
jgi:hypothetical protein